MAAGIVDDQRVRHAVAGHLPGGQLGALVARARLVDIDVDRNAGFGGEIDRRGGGAVVDGGQPAGIAVGQDVDRFAGLLGRGDLPDDLQAVLADAAVELDILVGDLGGPPIGGLGALGRRQGRQHAAHLVQRPAQIDGGRARLVQLVPDLVERRVRRIVAHLDGDAIGGGDADQRRAAHPHVADRRGDAGDAVDRLDAEIMRQPALVDDVDRTAVAVQPDGAVVAVSDVQATISLLDPSGQRVDLVEAVDAVRG